MADAPEIDRWALQRTQDVVDEVTAAYETYQFHQAFRTIYEFCVVDLSSFYLDALKDRLYTEAPGAPARRCAQTALYGILNGLVRLVAPMIPMTAEEVWQVMRDVQRMEEPSVHVASWPTRVVPERDPALAERWGTYLRIRDVVMKALEARRAKGEIGSSLEAQVILAVRDPALRHTCEASREALAEACVVSDLKVVADRRPAATGDGAGSVEGLSEVRIERAPGEKCQRCWKHLPSVGHDRLHRTLCARCVKVVAATQ